jgi:BirA family biotin operon repressor/biotin-[acetyl-CoA-carboxylase] ligase
MERADAAAGWAASVNPVRLDDRAIGDGFRLEWLETTGSTNDNAMARATAGAPGGLWLVAGEQTGGKGRRGRQWSSPRGNLYASLLLFDAAPMVQLAQLGFVAGVSVASAVRSLATPQDAFGIKWPNDLLSHGAKFTGLLLETRPVRDRVAVVIGFGVNCRSHPDGLTYPTTDLSTILGRGVEPADVFLPLSKYVAEFLETWDRGAGFARIRETWLGFATGLGMPLRVDTGTRSHEGTFEGIDLDGRLVLRGAEGPVTIEAGDVFLGFSMGSGGGAASSTAAPRMGS